MGAGTGSGVGVPIGTTTGCCVGMGGRVTGSRVGRGLRVGSGDSVTAGDGLGSAVAIGAATPPEPMGKRKPSDGAAATPTATAPTSVTVMRTDGLNDDREGVRVVFIMPALSVRETVREDVRRDEIALANHAEHVASNRPRRARHPADSVMTHCGCRVGPPAYDERPISGGAPFQAAAGRSSWGRCAASSSRRIFSIPSRMRPWTVPSGTSMLLAISDRDSPE